MMKLSRVDEAETQIGQHLVICFFLPQLNFIVRLEGKRARLSEAGEKEKKVVRVDSSFFSS